MFARSYQYEGFSIGGLDREVEGAQWAGQLQQPGCYGPLQEERSVKCSFVYILGNNIKDWRLTFSLSTSWTSIKAEQMFYWPFGKVTSCSRDFLNSFQGEVWRNNTYS